MSHYGDYYKKCVNELAKCKTREEKERWLREEQDANFREYGLFLGFVILVAIGVIVFVSVVGITG